MLLSIYLAYLEKKNTFHWMKRALTLRNVRNAPPIFSDKHTHIQEHESISERNSTFENTWHLRRRSAREFLNKNKDGLFTSEPTTALCRQRRSTSIIEIWTCYWLIFIINLKWECWTLTLVQKVPITKNIASLRKFPLSIILRSLKREYIIN